MEGVDGTSPQILASRGLNPIAGTLGFADLLLGEGQSRDQ